MSIRPIDLQVMIPKTVDVSRIQANEQHGTLAAMQSKVQSVEKQSEQNMKQVNSQKEINKIYIRDDNEKKGREQGRQNAKSSQQKQKEAKDKKPNLYSKQIPGSTIDIRL